MGWQIYSWRRSPKNNLNRALEAQNGKTQNSTAPSPPSARLHPPNHGRRRRRRFHFGGATRRGVRRRGHPRGRRVRRGPPHRDGRGGGRGPRRHRRAPAAAPRARVSRHGEGRRLPLRRQAALAVMRLRCSGVDPDEHPIKKEFERLSLWEEKLNRFEDWDKAPLRPTTTVNTQAAARFIGHSLPHLTTDQKRSMQAISRGEGGSYSGNKRKPQPPRPNKKSVRAATEEFLAKAALELSGHNDSKVKGPIRLLSDEDED
uniref:Nuclear nucleic acid-binding protein C1D n=1 Tax=Oryza glumipatula TaxID=40148 RepID=A0A0E0AT29_9ORYZ